MGKYNVLIVSPTGGYAGIDVCLENLIRSIDRTKFNLIVVFPLESILQNEFEKMGIKCYRLPLAWWFPIGVSDDTWKCALKNAPNAIEPLIHIIKDNKIDMVLSNTSVNFDGMIASAVCKVVHVLYMHAAFVPNIYTQLSDKEKSEIYKLMGYLSFRVVCCSQILQQFMSSFIDNSCTILNGIDVSSFVFKQRTLAHGEKLKMVCVGHYNDNKQQHFVIEVLNILKKKHQDILDRVHYTMIGPYEEEYIKKLKSMTEKYGLEKYVEFKSFSNDIRSELNNYNCYVNSSKTENFPLSVMEAMANGLPVLATVNDGTLQLIDNGITGMLFETEDEMADGIKDILTNTDKIEQMSKKSRLFIENGFTLDRLGNNFNELFEAACSSFARHSLPDIISDSYKYEVIKPITEHKPLRILVVYPRAAYASYYLAAKRPLQYLKDRGLLTFRSVTETEYCDSLLNEVDIVYCIRFYHSFAQGLVHRCKVKQIPFVWFIDDNYFALSIKNNNIKHEMVENDHYKLMFEISDVVLVNSGELYHVGNTLRSNVLRMPTYQIIDNVSEPGEREAVRFGFMGTLMRDEDFVCVTPAIKRILYEYGDKVEVEFIGYCPSELKEQAAVYEFINDYEKFRDFFVQRNWDFGIAPLANTTFNLSKTNNKYREYSSICISGIFSNILPYSTSITHLHNGYLVENNEDAWYEALKCMIDDDGLRKRLARAAYSDIRENYNLSCFANKLVNTFIELLPSRDDNKLEISQQMTEVMSTPQIRSREIESHLLYLSRHITKRRYTVTWQSFHANFLGLIFATYDSLPKAGSITVTIYYKKSVIRSVAIPLSNIQQNIWTYFPLNDMCGYCGLSIEIEIRIIAEVETARIGVFENRIHRSFSYKVLNKLGLQPKGKNTLYADYL